MLYRFNKECLKQYYQFPENVVMLDYFLGIAVIALEKEMKLAQVASKPT